MLKISFLKKKVLAFFFLFCMSFAYASQNNQNPFVLSDDGLLDLRAADKIYEIGSEVKSKLGVNIYVYAKENYGINMDVSPKEKFEQITKIENDIVKDLQKPFVLLSLSIDQTHVNLMYSDDLKQIIDKNDILNNYVVPLLASKDKNTLYAKVSASLLNGYAEIGDRLASSRGIELESSIGSAGYTAGTIWKMIMYTLVLGGIILYTYAILRQRKFR